MLLSNLKIRIVSIWKLLNDYFIIPFGISSFIVFILLFIFDLKIYSIGNYTLLYIGLVFGFIAFFLWFIKIEKGSKKRILITSLSMYIFIYSSIVFSILNISLIINNVAFNRILLLSITTILLLCSSIITYYTHSNSYGDTTPNTANKSINYYLYRYLPIVIILIFFIFIKLVFIFKGSGSYIDEYLNIISGEHLWQTGSFADFIPNIKYVRGGIISIMSGFVNYLGIQNINYLKIIPAFLGVINFCLLYLLARKYLSSSYVYILLLGYTLSSQVIFNHYYIRFFVFYEFIFLLLSYFFLTMEVKNNVCKKLFIILFVIASSIPATLDLGIYFCIFPALLTLFLIYIYNPELIKLKIAKYKRFLILLIILTLGSIAVNAPLRVWMLFFDTLATPPKFGLNYIWFFLEVNLPITITFVFGIISVARHKLNNKEKVVFYYVISIFILFTLHILSSKNIQVIRGIYYFIPIYFLFSLIGISTINNRLIKFGMVCIFFICIINSYPLDFLKHPYIPYEVNYVDNNAFVSAKKLCVNSSLIISSGRPEIMKFQGLHLDAFYFGRFHSIIPSDTIPEFEKMITVENGELKYYLTGTRILTNIKDLESFTKNRSYCFLDGFGLPNAWTGDEMTKYLRDTSSETYEDFKYSSRSFRSVIYLVK